MNRIGIHKETFDSLVKEICPSDLGLKDTFMPCGKNSDCEECWNISVLEQLDISRIKNE